MNDWSVLEGDVAMRIGMLLFTHLIGPLSRHIESELNDWDVAMPIFGDVAMRINPQPLAQSHIYRGGPMPLALTPCRIDV